MFVKQLREAVRGSQPTFVQVEAIYDKIKGRLLEVAKGGKNNIKIDIYHLGFKFVENYTPEQLSLLLERLVQLARQDGVSAYITYSSLRFDWSEESAH